MENMCVGAVVLVSPPRQRPSIRRPGPVLHTKKKKREKISVSVLISVSIRARSGASLKKISCLHEDLQRRMFTKAVSLTVA
jgi:hypothetical protein